MRKGVVPHAACVSEKNIHQLATFSTVFLCMDGHPIKNQILRTCMAHDTLFIDVGMGLYRVGDSIAGTLRTTTCYPGNDQHASRLHRLSRRRPHRENTNGMPSLLN